MKGIAARVAKIKYSRRLIFILIYIQCLVEVVTVNYELINYEQMLLHLIFVFHI